MGEGIISGILGDEDEKPEVEAPETVGGAEAFAAAIALHASIQNPEIAKDTSAFLRGQLHLVEVQTKHLEEEHGLRMSHLRNQLREENVRRLGLRLRVGFQLFLILVATVIGVGGAVLIHDAITSRRVVIEAFATAPSLATRGVTGTVVAAGVLDEITHLQNATHTSVAAKRDLSSAWSNELRLRFLNPGSHLVRSPSC